MSRWRIKNRGSAEPPILPLTITGTPTPIITQNVAYPTFTPSTSGGSGGNTFSLTGTLPTGLSFSTVTGAISGTPTGSGTSSGLNITVTDSVLNTASLGVFSITVNAVAPPGDLTVPIYTTDQQFVDVTDWLATIPDNRITVTVDGDVSMRVWGYEADQTDGQSRSWVVRKLKESLVAVTTAAAVADGTWTFTALDGAGETGSLSTYVVTLAVQATPVATITVGGVLDKAGYGGFPLSRLGAADDWVLDTQSDTVNSPLALWDGTDVDAARIAWASTGATPTTSYGGTKKVAAPTPGDAAYTATVSSVTLGIVERVITFDVDAAIVRVGPCPATGRDSATVAPFNQIIDVLDNGTAAGTVVWGLTILSNEGTYNPTAVNQDWAPMQPTGTAPTSPYGTNASPSWDYEDGWNPNFVNIRSDVPGRQCRWLTSRLNTALLAGGILGYRWTGFDLNKSTNTTTGGSFFIRNQGATGSAVAVHGVVFDHCFDVTVSNTGGAGYSTMWIVAYNDFDNDNYNWFTPPSGSTGGAPIGLVGKDCQTIGNVFRHMYADILNTFTYCSTVGNGRNKTSWNLVVDKSLGFGAHSDFAQPIAVQTAEYKSATLTPPGTDIDWGEWVGNMVTKGKGKLYDSNDVGYIGLYFLASSVTGGTGFAVDDVLTSDLNGRTATVRRVIDTRELQVQLTDAALPFSYGEPITASPSGTTGVTSGRANVSGVVGSFVAGNILRNAGDTKRAEIIAVNGSPTPTSLDLKFTVGSAFTPSPSGEGTLTNVSTGGTCTMGSYASAAVTTWAGGTPQTTDIGKTVGDCQGMFASTPQTPVTATEKFRSDVNHIYIFAGHIHEGLSDYGIYRLPPPKDSADVIIVNNLVTPAWGTISEKDQAGAYYEEGRMNPGGATIFPDSPAISGITTIGSRIIGRNVFMCGPTFQGVTGQDDLVGTDFGSPTDDVTSVPTQVTDAMIDPTGTATRSSVGDIAEDYSPAPGGILTTQGTAVNYGAIVDEIDWERHTYDRAALASLA